MCFTDKKTDPSYINKGKTKPEGKKKQGDCTVQMYRYAFYIDLK